MNQLQNLSVYKVSLLWVPKLFSHLAQWSLKLESCIPRGDSSERAAFKMRFRRSGMRFRNLQHLLGGSPASIFIGHEIWVCPAIIVIPCTFVVWGGEVTYTFVCAVLIELCAQPFDQEEMEPTEKRSPANCPRQLCSVWFNNYEIEVRRKKWMTLS